jgi:hypothetical protein
MLLCAAVLTVLLVISGIEQNPGPGVEAENILHVLCSGRWFHNSCGNVKAQMTDNGKWSCDRWRWDRLRQLEEKLESAVHQIEELKRKNRGLEDQLRGAVAGCDLGSRVTVQRQHVDAESLVLGDSIIHNVEADHLRVQCFPGIRTE